jgi:lipopolysaccharide transport system permease protein
MTLRHYATLIDTMARMALKADASRYFFGYIWWVLEPLLYVAVFYVVFEVILGGKRADFLVFLMCGKLTFIWFSKSVNQASRSIVAGKGIIGKIDVPKSLFPLATIQEGLYKQLSVFLLLFAVLLFKGYGVTPAWLWLLPVVLVNYLMIVACSLFGAFLVCLAFDFSMLISLGMIFLLFTSGIFWDVRGLADPAMTDAVLTLNPVAFIIDAYRQVLLAATAPDALHLAAVGLGAAGLSLLGLLLLHRSSRFLALKAITA